MMNREKIITQIPRLLCLSIMILLQIDSASSQVKKNVIVMIVDGFGYNQLKAVEYWNGGAQPYESWPVQYAMSTYRSGGSYDTLRAWREFSYVMQNYTESAEAATAMATGVKTSGGAIGVGLDQQPLENLFERAEASGMATGVVTSVQWTHATPAGFSAHNMSRNNYSQIANDMVFSSNLDVIMGAGHPLYNNNGETTGADYQYVGGQRTWDALVSGLAGNDADDDGVADRWTLIQTRSDFQNLANGAAPKRVLGTAQVRSTLQQGRSGGPSSNDPQPPYTVPLLLTVPTLEEMTRAALNVLDDDPDGFALMIEGGAVDWANHANQLGRMIEEQIDFNNAFAAVVGWVETYSNWDETLVILTGDHETGYLLGPGSGAPATFNPIVDSGAGLMPGYLYYSGSHTNSLIPLFARGAGSDQFTSYATRMDSVRGAFIDNINIADVVFSVLPPLPVGQILHVPGDYSSIQSAIDAAGYGDTILVDKGVYYENINFHGKKIVVASHYVIDQNTMFIDSTTINGSLPHAPDTASVVVFISGENRNSVLEGFTLTGGTGTEWLDIHNGNIYREGGGILCEFSSPVIKNNVIIGNTALLSEGMTSSGGGGIRIGDSNPIIANNAIMNNRGRYGGGIVLNYTGAVIKNNTIYKNTGGEDFGGSGVWAYENGGAPKVFQNNTVIENASTIDGGGVLVWSTSMTLNNSIIWGNTAPSWSQVRLVSGNVYLNYCDIQGGWSGSGNINLNPLFIDTSAYLLSGSPCIDSGEPNDAYKDPEDPTNPGFAMWPSNGSLRNDIGAYGGPGRAASVYFDLHLNDPLQPTQLTLYSDYLTPASISLSWEDPFYNKLGDTLTGFSIHVYRNDTLVAVVDSSVQTFIDEGLNLHQLYNYSLNAVIINDSSEFCSGSAYAGGHEQSQPPTMYSARDAIEGVILEWKNPSRQLDNTPLNDFAYVFVYRDSILVESIPQSMTDTGQYRSFLDTVEGYHEYQIRISDNEIPVHYSSYTNEVIGSNIITFYQDGFESGLSKIYRTGQWDTVSNISHDSLHCITDSPNGDYTENSSTSFITPPVIIDNSGLFQLSHIVIVANSDYALIDISTDGRKSYQIFKSFDKNSHPEWQDGIANPGDWFTYTYDLSSYAGDTIVIRFRLLTGAYVNADGWYLDDIVVGPLVENMTNPYEIGDEWNMISIPLNFPNSSRDILYPHASSSAFTYSKSYIFQDSLHRGKGYWIKFDSTETVYLSGEIVRKETINVNERWNMIGSASFPVDTIAITSIPDANVKSKYYTYDGSGYYSSQIIAPGKAYWVKVAQSGKLVLSSFMNKIRPYPEENNLLLELNKFTITDSNNHKQDLYLGWAEKLKTVLDQYELPPLPPEGAFDVRFNSQRSVEVIDPGSKNELTILLHSVRFPITISGDFKDRTLSMVFEVNDQELSLDHQGMIHINSLPRSELSEEYSIKLRVYCKNLSTKPKEYSLNQNYPNPFNPTTLIEFDLPEQAFVTLKVYNILGQEVQTLLNNEKMDDGTQVVEFEGSSYTSGIYFYRLMAKGIMNEEDGTVGSNYVNMKKMLLVK